MNKYISKSKGKKHLTTNEVNRKAYNKLSTKDKLEYDLAQMNKDEKNIKDTFRARGYSSKKLNKYIEKKLGVYEPSIKKIDNLVYAGKDIIRIKFDENKFEKRHFSLSKVQKISDEFTKYLEHKGVTGKMMTSLIYGDLGWKSGKFKDIGDEVDLYDPDRYYDNNNIDKPKNVKSFSMYIALGQKQNAGGNDAHNDCLYNCLKYFIFDVEKFFKTPAELKKFLKLGRDDKVPVKYIDQIEKKLQTFQINIMGDYIRTSTIQSNKVININLINGHYEVIKPNRPSLTPYIKFNEKKVLLYDKISFEGYDGNRKWILTKAEKNNIIYQSDSEYILIDREEQRDENNQIIKITIEEEFDKFIKIADDLKIESKGLINLYKSGNYVNASLDLFDRMTKYLSNVEMPLQDETIWIDNSSFSSIIWAEEYTGEMYSYDIKSAFAYLMTLNTNKFPIKRGEFKVLDKLEDIIQFGIYRCVIKKSVDENINKLFQFNKLNYYTSLDINYARKLNLQIELIQDSKPNFLFYSADKCVKFGEIFKPIVDLLFDLKEKKINKSKAILTRIWGALCQINKKKYFATNTYDIAEDEEILEIYPCKNDESIDIIKTTKLNNYYKTPYCRLGSFLLSKMRSFLGEIMLSYKENVHRIYVDGFITDKLIHSNIDVGLGELKYCGYNSNGTIKNKTNKIEFHY